MNAAIIDLGTNTFNLLIVEINADKKTAPVYSQKFPVKLGEGGILKKEIQSEPFKRGLDAMKLCKGLLEKYEVKITKAFATSAVREATNGKLFVKTVEEETGIQIGIIDGDREAELIYYGVREALNVGDKPALIMDIGGGSTEFIIADQNKVYWEHSYLLGVSRLLQEFSPSDPISDLDIQKLEQHFEKELASLFDAIKLTPITELIGSSGSFDSFAEVAIYRFNYQIDPDTYTEFEFNMNQYKIIADSLLHSTSEQRKAIKGLVRLRVDMIVVAVVLVNFVLKKLNISKMRNSAYSLKEGVLAELIKEI